MDVAALTRPVVDEDLFMRGPLIVGDVPQEPLAFQPRQDLVARLDTRRAGTSVIYAMTGMRGVGKTQVAAAYARFCINAGWRLVAWVDASDTGSMLAGLSALAARLGLSTVGADAAGAANVRHWLESDGDNCLLIFDDVSDISGLRPFLPAAGAARVLITSARRAAGNLGADVAVDVFSPDEGLTYLSMRTNLDDQTGANELADEMGWLPLGLAQAAAVIVQQRLSYGTYLERLRAVRLDDYLEHVEGDPYPRRVAEAILLSLQTVSATDQSGSCRGVMSLVAVLSPSGVSRAFLRTASDMGVISAVAHLGHEMAHESDNPATLSSSATDEVISRLADWSLLTFSVDGSLVTSHTLVKRVVRERSMVEGTYATLADLTGHLLATLADRIGERIWENPAEIPNSSGMSRRCTSIWTATLATPQKLPTSSATYGIGQFG